MASVHSDSFLWPCWHGRSISQTVPSKDNIITYMCYNFHWAGTVIMQMFSHFYWTQYYMIIIVRMLFSCMHKWMRFTLMKQLYNMLSWDVTNPQRIMTEIVPTICFPFNISLLTYYEKKSMIWNGVIMVNNVLKRYMQWVLSFQTI